MTDKLCIKVTKDILLMICFFIYTPPSPMQTPNRAKSFVKCKLLLIVLNMLIDLIIERLAEIPHLFA